jgi:hypothetical protein
MLTPYQIAEELSSIAMDSEKIWKDYSTAKATYENLSEYKKVMFAQAFARSDAKSDKKREMEATTSIEYVRYLNGLAQANHDYLKALAEVKSLEIRLAAMQSLNKLTAAELNHNIAI